MLGRYARDGRITRENLIKLFREIPALRGLPVIANCDFGQAAPVATLPNGGRCQIHASDEQNRMFSRTLDDRAMYCHSKILSVLIVNNSPAILLVADLFHPVHDFAIQLFLNGDVGHPTMNSLTLVAIMHKGN